MKPAWDRLMSEFEGSETALVADVDCTGDGKALCTKVGVKGYPTLKYGDPNNLEDYKGGREYDDLLTFAQENFDDEVKKLQKTYEKLNKEKEAAVKAAKD